MGFAPPRAADTDALQAVVAAARACFARYGVHRTRMEDVAHEAGMVRQTLYDFVAGRDQLIELALVQWCRDLSVRIRPLGDLHAADPREGFVEFLAAIIEITRADEEFARLSDAMGRVKATELLAGPSPVHAIVVDALHPALETARLADLLREDVTEDEIVSWLSGILAMMTSRADLRDAELRHVLRKFAIPAVFAPDAG